MREWILVLLAAGVCIGWLIERRRMAKELQALEREARDARAEALQAHKKLRDARAEVLRAEKKLRRELAEARTCEADARRTLDQQMDRFSEQLGSLANGEEEARRAKEEAAEAAQAFKDKSREVERLQREVAESRAELAAAKAEVQETREALHDATARMEEIEGAAQTSAKANDDLLRALEEERRQRRGSADRVAELEAEMKRFEEEGWPAKGGDHVAEAATVEAEPRSSEQPESPEPIEPEVKEVLLPTVPPADVAAESGPAVEQKTPAPSASGGATFLDVLDADSNLNDGQRETIRVAYSGFAPKATKGTGASVDPDLTVVDLLEADPNLNWGQRETIRALYTQFVRKVEARGRASSM
jgi:hypothetical protein